MRLSTGRSKLINSHNTRRGYLLYVTDDIVIMKFNIALEKHIQICMHVCSTKQTERTFKYVLLSKTLCFFSALLRTWFIQNNVTRNDNLIWKIIFMVFFFFYIFFSQRTLVIFVSNSVKVILSLTNASQWRHTSGKNNTAYLM